MFLFGRLKHDSRSRPSSTIPPPPTESAAFSIQPKPPISPTASAFQLSSPLFTVLPPEIRLQIYSYVIPATHTFYITYHSTKIRRILQPAAEDLCFVENHDEIWHLDHTAVGRKKSNRYLLSAGPNCLSRQVACLLVCRKMYVHHFFHDILVVSND